MASHNVILDRQLYKKSFSLPPLKCLKLSKVKYALQEIHERICKNHLEGRSLAYKDLRQGYYCLRYDRMRWILFGSVINVNDMWIFYDNLLANWLNSHSHGLLLDRVWIFSVYFSSYKAKKVSYYRHLLFHQMDGSRILSLDYQK